MTKFIKFLSALLLAFAAVNLLYLFLLPRIDWDFAKAKEAYELKGKQLELLVVGNSTAMDGINTEMLSKEFGEAYNFSVGGATLQANYVQLQEYLLHNKTPKRVLLFLSSAHLGYKKENVVNPIVEYYYGGNRNEWGLQQIPIFKFRWLFNENLKKLLSPAHRSAKVVQGQLRINKSIPDNSSPPKKMPSCNDELFYTGDGYAYMWKIAALCMEKNIALAVFEMPCWKDAQNNCADVQVSKQGDGKSYSLLIQNLNTYQLCDSVINVKTDWLSRNHLNYNGSLKITAVVAEKIRKQPPVKATGQ
jgi:hypothetical protein